jgi:hypothetical protein
MAFGPGKYDAEVTELRERLNPDGVVLLVLGGERGGGFSAQLTAPGMLALPALLRQLAEQIEKDSYGQ